MKIKNTEKIIINSIKIKGNKKIINYSRHLSHGKYNNCMKAIYYNIDIINLKWV
jgi:hypothetical protein